MTDSSKANNRLLVIGVYLSDKPNLALAVTRSVQRSDQWQVECRWARIGDTLPEPELQELTQLVISKPTAKTTILNRLLQDVSIDDYEYIMILDDDIELSEGFTDRYLAIVSRRGYALSQPARTHNSYIDHYFVGQLLGIESRETNFVEIGPLCTLHRSAYPVLLPLNEDPPMGWGLDFVWPVQCHERGLSLGIVDVCPVDHSFRKPVSYYDYEQANAGMQAFFAKNEHLTYEECFHILESYPLEVSNA
jgi:hypothetical protein